MTIIPNKSAYSVGEVFDELKQGTLYQKFAKANPKEAEILEAYAHMKVNSLGGTSPLLSVLKSHTGRAIYMTLMTLPAQPRDR